MSLATSQVAAALPYREVICRMAGSTGCARRALGPRAPAGAWALVVLAALLTCAAPFAYARTGARVAASATFRRSGLARLNSPHYEYEVLGLGGTTVRPGPTGFTVLGAPGVAPGGYIDYRPYLAYQYWWESAGHRQTPFDLAGGYGPDAEPGAISAFRHVLDTGSGVLRCDLGLRVGGADLRSTREEFVTPDGVLVIRVVDSGDGAAAAGAFRLRVLARPGFRARAAGDGDCAVVVATRDDMPDAFLAVATAGGRPSADGLGIVALSPRRPCTIFLAPASASRGDDAATARRHALAARARGFAALREDTRRWWRAFYGQSSVSLPDARIAEWYRKSLYYHGVFFGNTAIPPGMWGTNPAGYYGAIVPEYDLVFSQLALLYTGHFAEARHVADWLVSILPQCEANARHSALYSTTISHSAGAKYGWIVGPDGRIIVPPQAVEATNLYSNFPGANAAAMALAYADYTGDPGRLRGALRILREATQVIADDLRWSPDLGGYVDRHVPNSVQQSAAAFALGESVRRGVAEPAWRDMARKVYLPTGLRDGARVMLNGPCAASGDYSGAEPWLIGLWWYGILPPTDPVARATYRAIDGSPPASYVFNRGWAAVYAARLGDGAGVVRHLRSLLEPGRALHDDTCLGEILHDSEDFKKTPEIAAHGALIAAVAQALLDGDERRESGETALTVFPAVTDDWARAGVGFRSLAAKGRLRVTARLTSRGAWFTVANQSRRAQVRRVALRLPPGAARPGGALLPAGCHVDRSFAVFDDLALPPGAKVTRQVLCTGR